MHIVQHVIADQLDNAVVRRCSAGHPAALHFLFCCCASCGPPASLRTHHIALQERLSDVVQFRYSVNEPTALTVCDPSNQIRSPEAANTIAANAYAATMTKLLSGVCTPADAGAAAAADIDMISREWAAALAPVRYHRWSCTLYVSVLPSLRRAAHAGLP